MCNQKFTKRPPDFAPFRRLSPSAALFKNKPAQSRTAVAHTVGQPIVGAPTTLFLPISYTDSVGISIANVVYFYEIGRCGLCKNYRIGQRTPDHRKCPGKYKRRSSSHHCHNDEKQHRQTFHHLWDL